MNLDAKEDLRLLEEQQAHFPRSCFYSAMNTYLRFYYIDWLVGWLTMCVYNIPHAELRGQLLGVDSCLPPVSSSDETQI